MMTVQVLGTGCRKCVALKEHVDAAIQQAGIQADVQKVEDINEIVKFGVMSTPALAVDGEVKIVGKVATVDEIVKVLQS
ncbi:MULTISPECIES: thioredoxin family protein [Pirellulaceae]|uniref:Small redox-active disulfide protein 2 n=1 Tax=Aporhodopirellula rubra TaxID=980271 RepID=A0A7W5E2G0_9BACT|nr:MULTISPECIES: thioredoxin family protein [Pirellulaceae]MBB3208890.1 small redox-active disulfide protein 2 [Aporhodopirellula rubra]